MTPSGRTGRAAPRLRVAAGFPGPGAAFHEIHHDAQSQASQGPAQRIL